MQISNFLQVPALPGGSACLPILETGLQSSIEVIQTPAKVPSDVSVSDNSDGNDLGLEAIQ